MKRLITSSDALLALQRGLTGDRNLAGTRYMDDPACLTAYADYYLAVSKAQTLRACSLSGLRPSAVLDMGAGPGSVSLALAGLGARSFTLVDSSSRALSMASEALAEMSREYGEPFAVSTLVADLESVALPLPPGVAYDLVAFGHCLNEIGGADAGPVADAAALARRLGIVRRSASSPGDDRAARYPGRRGLDGELALFQRGPVPGPGFQHDGYLPR
jgi:SAM-dependent methyltransferase